MSSSAAWKGVPRDQIPWFPTVDIEKCTGCQECFNFCRHGVYAWDQANNRTVVDRPFECVVGCSTCAGMCDSGAISFPPLTMLKGIGGQTP